MAKTVVDGVVASVAGTGVGFTVKEVIESPTTPGKTWDRYWRCWYPRQSSHSVVKQGDTVSVSGEVSAKVSEKNPRYVDFILNDVTVTPSSPTATPEPDGYGDPWATAPIPDDERTPW